MFFCEMIPFILIRLFLMIDAEIMAQDHSVEVSRVLQLISEEEIPELPPGSLLGAK